VSRIIPFLSAATGLSELDVRGIIGRAPISYKHYTIKKRSGGDRLISQPAREVKALQRALVAGLAQLPIHDSAMAYRSGISIADNAAKHVANGPIMKFDFKNFFPSILVRDWVNYCNLNKVFLDEADIAISGRLFFHRSPGSHALRLAIGAPSSPWLSNVLMYEFDRRISALVASDRVTYTRYADDLTFSAPRTGFLNGVERQLRKLIHEIQSPKLIVNEEKSVVATLKYRRVVTGLVLANDGRVTIGRDRKRVIRAALNNAFAGKNTDEENARLAGWLAFAGDVEPLYLETIKRRYGVDLLARLTRPSLTKSET
jgi:hypothetical protein